MSKISKTEPVTQISQRRLGLITVLFAVILWAVAANLISSLFAAGVKPFELAVSSMTIATFGLAVVNSFMIKAEAKAMSWQQFILGLLFAGLTGVNYLAIARLPVAVAILLLFTSPIMVVLWTALTTRHMPTRSVLAAMLLLIRPPARINKYVPVRSSASQQLDLCVSQTAFYGCDNVLRKCEIF